MTTVVDHNEENCGLNKSVFLGWGLGSFTTSVLVNSVGLLHLRFMTDSLGIGVGVAGTLVALSKIYDAAADPIMGMISDRTTTRWGRYRPYLLSGGFLSAVSLILMFNVPARATGPWLVVYVACALILFSTAYTMFRIPYLAMGADITRGFDQRSRMMTFGVYGSAIGSLFATSAAPFLLAKMGSDRAGHGVVAWILALLIATGGLACFKLLRIPVALPGGARRLGGFRDGWIALRGNPPFLILIGFKLIMFTGLALHGSVIPFYTRHVLKASDTSLGWIFFAQTLAMMLSQMGWVRVASRFGRRNALIAAALLEALAMVGWILVPASQPAPWVQLLGVAEGLCGGGLFFGLYTVLADTMTFDRQRSGIEREGVFAGVFVMVEKITAALGTAIFAAILSAVGFVSARDSGAAAQPANVAAGILVALAVLPAIAALLACMVLRHYRLPPDRDQADAVQADKTLKIVRTGAIGAALALTACTAPEKSATPIAQPALVTPMAIPDSLRVKHVYSGSDGESHLDEIELPRAGGDGRSISSRLYATDVETGYSPPGLFMDWHGVSTPRFLIILSGVMEIGLGDGSRHLLKTGDIVLVMDTGGRGHTSRVVGDAPVLAMTVRLPKDDPLKLKPGPCPDTMPAANCVANKVAASLPRQ